MDSEMNLKNAHLPAAKCTIKLIFGESVNRKASGGHVLAHVNSVC